MGKQIYPKMDFPFKSYDKKLVFLQRMGSFFPCRAQGKKKFFPNPCGQLLRNFLHIDPKLKNYYRTQEMEQCKAMKKISFTLIVLQPSNHRDTSCVKEPT
jgi:hypothetical protein